MAAGRQELVNSYLKELETSAGTSYAALLGEVSRIVRATRRTVRDQDQALRDITFRLDCFDEAADLHCRRLTT